MIMFLDTAAHNRIVSIYDDNKEIVTKIEKNDLNLSSRMLPMISEAIKEANVSPNEIETILIVTGPGSFTGIRVGVTIAKTWAWALNKKIVPISELELLATTEFDGDYIIPYIDARRDFGFAAIYDKKGQVILEDQHISNEELLSKIPDNKKIVFTTYDDVNFDYKIIRPEPVVEKIIKKYKNELGVNPNSCNPNYLKRTEAEENLEKKNQDD